MSGDTERPVPPATRSWWSPAGWTQAPGPGPFEGTLYSDVPDDGSDWDTELRRAGYMREGGMVPDESEISSAGYIAVYRHTDHLAVETSDLNGQTALFFVAGKDIAAFRTTLLPPMVQAAATAWMAEEMRLIRRTFVAFVRHGHGESTVDEDGTQDRDERLREMASQRARRATKGGAP